MERLIEQDPKTGFTYSKVYKKTVLHKRIRRDKKGYERAKRNAKKDTGWKPIVAWYEGRENKLSDHERIVQKKFISLRDSKKPDGSPYLYADIAKLAGCSTATVSEVLNSKNQLSEKLANEILKNLAKRKESPTT